MDIEKKIKKAEELAEKSSEKYQIVTYQEILRYLILTDKKMAEDFNAPKNDTKPVSNDGARKKEIPEAYLVAQHGDFKHQVAWAIMRLIERGEEGNVKSVRDIIDLELSLKRPSRPHTSNTLAQLVPKYLSRKKPESGKGYVYLPNSNTANIFDDLLNPEK